MQCQLCIYEGVQKDLETFRQGNTKRGKREIRGHLMLGQESVQMEQLEWSRVLPTVRTFLDSRYCMPRATW